MAMLLIINGENMNKTAFLIGNSDYQKLDKLETPTNDVHIISRILKKYDFHVNLHKNTTSHELYSIYHDFKECHKESGIVLFYFAGHGFQANKNNYIAPIDMGLDDNFKYNAIETTELSALLNKNEDVYTLIFIDACRNTSEYRKNILYRSHSKDLIIKKGFYESVISKNTLIMTSTNYGKTALDKIKKDDTNSPYACAFIEALAYYPKSINEIVIDIQNKVEELTKRKQIPTTLSSLNKLVYLKDNNLPHKNIRWGRRLFLGTCLCSSDSSKFRASVFFSKKNIIVDYPNHDVIKNKGCVAQNSIETIDRYGISWQIPDNKEITSICNREYFFVAGTADGYILFNNHGSLCSKKLSDDAIWDIDINLHHEIVVFCTCNGVYEYRYKNDIFDIKNLSNTNSYAVTFGTFTDNICYSETDKSQRTKIIFKSITDNTIEILNIENYCQCYDLISIEKYNVVVGATDRGIFFWELGNSKTCIFKNEDISYICLSINCSCDIIIAATENGEIEFWDIENLIMLDKIKICTRDTAIISIAWTNTNSIILTTSEGILFQVYNNEPEMPNEDI